MKQTWSITKAELAQLFFSPIAWLIIVLFCFQAYQVFSGLVVKAATDQDLYNKAANLTYTIFSHQRGLFQSISSNLYLFIPLLTMGLMSRDLSSGAIKLLYSSPVSPSRIIVGKFGAMIIFSFVLLGAVIPTIAYSWISIPRFDIWLVLSGLLGLMLLIWAYSAIGLFMSSLTGYQIVAALLTFGTFALMDKLSGIGQNVEFLRELTYWASLSGRTDQFIEGLISSEDLIYFLLVVALFISFSIFLLQYRRDRRLGLCIAKYAGSLLVVLMLGYTTSRPALTAYYDASRTKANTITGTSRKIVESIEGPLDITTYVNLSEYDAWLGSPYFYTQEIRKYKAYMRFKPDIRMKYVYYYDEPYNNFDYDDDDRIPTLEMAQKFAESFGIPFRRVLTPGQIRGKIDLLPEKNSIVKVLESADGHRVFLRMFEDMLRFPEEPEISTAMNLLTNPPLRAGFLTGHGERSIIRTGDGDFSGFTTVLNQRNSMVNTGFDVRQINLASEDDPLTGLDLLVIADLRTPLSKDEEQAVSAYLENGGNMLLAVDPQWIDFSKPLLRQLGLYSFPGTVVYTGTDYVPTLIPAEVSSYGRELSYLLGQGMTVTMPGAASIDYRLSTGWEAIPLLVTPDDESWNETGVTDFAALPDSVRLTADISAGEFVRSHNLGMALTRPCGNREQRIIVLGDADCLGNMELTINRKNMPSFNDAFRVGLFHWLSGGRSPVDVRRPAPPDGHIDLTPERAATSASLLKWIIPALLALTGAVIVLRRLRR